MIDTGDGWTGRRTQATRVAFHENGATIVFQNGTLIAEAKGVTPRVLAFLFGDLITEHTQKTSG